MTPLACGAAEFLGSRGPAVVPLRACCVAAMVRASPVSGLDSSPFVCAAEDLPVPRVAVTAERES